MTQNWCLNSSSWQVIHPLISLTGGIFVWVGVWDYLVDYLHGGSAAYDWMYMLVGLSFLFLTRTVIAQAGLKPFAYTPASISSPAPFYAPILDYLSSSSLPPTSTSASSLPLYLRSFLALLAGITFWLGAYNLFDLHLYEFGSVYRDLIYAAVGLALMFLTSNVASEGAVVADNTDPSLASSASLKTTTVLTSTQSFLFYHAKALVGLFGDVIYWVGAYNLADTHLWTASPTRDALYVVFGMLVFLGVSLWTFKERQQTRGMRAHRGGDGGANFALLDAGAQVQPGMSDRLAFYVRCAVAMVAGVVVWVGWWNVLSSWVVSSDAAPAYDEAAEAAHTWHPLSRLGAAAPSVHVGWRLMQRSSTSESSFPMWVLYALYAFTGLVFLVVTNTFTSQAGVIAPLGLIRQQANVGVAAMQAGDGGAAPQSDTEHPQLGAETTAEAFSHAVGSS